ncbi:MAG TPA: carboxypeptidase-like regulatory domain-containing protein [Terriglobia bacterium]|nr:carboxypeptidase-like regulatory domain-containing protein [Terriglobia bacterium]
MQSRFSGKLTALVAALALMLVCSFSASAQTLTTGAISGVVTDPSGAVVPNATVTATAIATNSSRTVQTAANGTYTLPQLGLGDYRISVKAAGFRTSSVGPIAVQVAQTQTANITLEVGTATQTVEVTAQGSIIQTDNPNTTTTVNANSIANLPNPGGDLTYEAQVAPGALMNSSGGYGNVEYNGLPSGANNFTIDGLDDNDPFLNLNNSGATNLLLGSDAIQEVTVNTTSYATDQGRLSAAQINYTTKSGTNSFHGSAHEIWNGSKFNSADFFTNSSVPFGGNGRKPRSNVNDFAANIGGPIVKDKWFFFADLEGTRIVVPVIENNITYPSAAFQQFVLNTTLPAAGASAQVPFYNNIFSLYNTPSNATPVPATDCPFDVGGGPPAIANTGNGCAVHSSFSLANRAKETLFTTRVDRAGDKNQVWLRFQLDNGTQPTNTDPVNPLFDAISVQPERNGNAGWTHTFGPNLVNQFNPGWAWYTAKFGPLNLSKTLAAFPEVLGGFFASYPFTQLGGVDYVWPQGRNVTQYQINDNLTWTKGKHTMIFGENMRRVLVSDFDFGFFNTPIVGPIDLNGGTNSGLIGFETGQALSVQSFPVTLSEPIGVINLDSFFNDNFKVTPKLTFIYGVRATWNGNPVNQHGQYSRPIGDFNSFPHDVNTPINAVLKPTSTLFPSTPKILWQPRGAIAWQVRNNTVLRAGFGVFSDIFPASLADSEAQNPPFDPQFVSFGDISNTTPNGVIPNGIAANQNFQAGFNSGVLSCAATNAPANCLSSVGFTGVPSGQYQYPYSLQYSAGVEQQWANTWGLKVQYVGTRQVHEPYTVNPNLTALCAGCFAPLPSVTPDPRFAGVTQYIAGAGSHYNALQVEASKRLGHGLQFSLNYTYSHCTDTISNGGIFGFAGAINTLTAIPGDLQRNYGNCDYDVRHAFNGNYLYELPFHSSTGWINQIVGGWQVSGDLFLRGGFPFTAVSSNCTNDLGSNGTTTPPCYASPVSGASPYQQFGNAATLAGAGINAIQWLNPNGFLSATDPSSGDCSAGETIVGGVVTATNNSAATCQFGSIGRNTLRAPAFKWTDLFVTKRFKLTERVSLRLDGQFYNLFNHPNFTYPGNAVGNPLLPGTTLGVGAIGAEVTPPTGLLGSFLGGDNAVRQIAFQARIDF